MEAIRAIDQIDLKTEVSDANFFDIALTALRLTETAKKFLIGQKKKEIEIKEIDLEEVSNHDSIDDCWIIIYDRVYDVTNFLKMVC